MVRAFWFGLVAMALMLASPALAKPHLFDDGAAPLKIVITAPFTDLVRGDRAPKPFPATFEFTDGAAAPQDLAIQVTARGLTRRTAGFCSFPPILLSFDKAADHDTLFKGQKKLKLVTYCRPQPDYEQRIVLEYLAYRLYNLITPMSFKVRAAEVTYRTSATDAGTTRFGYLLEDIKDVAGRNDLDVLKATTHQVSVRQLDPHATARAALFEYMISNLDWEFLAAPAGVECCHNSRLLAAHDATAATATAIVPVPYDYDFSGLVDSPYATPPAGIPEDEVTQRYYRGYCISTPEIASVVQEYLSHRAEMTAVLNNEPHLNAEFRGKAQRFLDGFFDILNNPGRVQSQITGHCR